MPDFWRFPTVSMGLGPINAIYQARFMRYLENRGMIPATPRKVWAFLGDGEMDEPESMGSLTLASREKLDNLIFVINCNLQRLDGPVRGNGKVIQELEAAFRGAGWNVIKVIWGERLGSRCWRATPPACCKSAWAKWWTASSRPTSPRTAPTSARTSSASIPELLDLVAHLSDDDLLQAAARRPRSREGLQRLQAAVETKGQPTLILAHTIKGYGLGEAGEGRNITHQQKKLNEQEIAHFRSRFEIPIPDEAARNAVVLPAAGRQPGDGATCTSGAASWAATCPAARCRPARSRRRRSSTSRNRSKARPAAKSPPPWRSCAS